MQGTITVAATGHIVLLGYTPGRTERIADELMAHGDRELVLCTWEDVATHPIPDRDIAFVRGELTDVEVLRRAGVHQASTVLVDVRDDNEALAVALTVDRIQSGAHVVVTLRDMARASQIGYVDEGIHCVQWHTPRMVTEELESPGIPSWDVELAPGATLYYVATDRVLVSDWRTRCGRPYDRLAAADRRSGDRRTRARHRPHPLVRHPGGARGQTAERLLLRQLATVAGTKACRRATAQHG